jgi:hypothetical protein
VLLLYTEASRVTPGETVPVAKVLKFVDRESDLILYEPEAAARALSTLFLADSVSTWGDLRRLRSSEPADLVDPILDHLWEEWADGAGASTFGLDEDDPDLREPKSFEDLSGIFPDDQELSIRVAEENGDPLFMDPFDPDCMGVPKELRRYYVDQSTMMSTWFAPESADLPEIRRVAEGLGWRVEEGSLEDLPHWG